MFHKYSKIIAEDLLRIQKLSLHGCQYLILFQQIAFERLNLNFLIPWLTPILFIENISNCGLRI